MKTKTTYIKSLLAAIVVLAAWMVPTKGWADNVITLGEDGTVSEPLPIYFNCRRSYTQQLYTKEEMGGKAQLIRKICFYYNGADSTFKAKAYQMIYMGNTSKTYFSSEKDFVPINNLVHVAQTIVKCDGEGWCEITLDTPFYYDGNGGLVVAINDCSGSTIGSSSSTFRHSSTNSYMTLTCYNNNEFGTVLPDDYLYGTNRLLRSRVSTKFITEDVNIIYYNSSKSGTSNEYPVSNYDKYSYSQQLYTKGEMGGRPLMIQSVWFYYDYSSAMTQKNDVVIYMGHKAESSFSNTSDYLHADKLTQVYSGNLNCKQGWNVFTLSTPFLYNGTDNLVVAVDDNSGNYNGSSYTFKVAPTSDYKTLCYKSSRNNPDPASDELGSFTSNTAYQSRVITAFTTSPATFTITTGVNDTSMGSVSGGGTYTYGTSAELTATPETGYHFEKWNDGVTNATRTETVTGDNTYTATFAPNQYEITTSVDDKLKGSVSGGGTYNYGTSAELTATPTTGYTFKQWDDGVTTNPRTVTVTGNKTYTANFELARVTVTGISENEEYGYVEGGGSVYYGRQTALVAVANDGYEFSHWDNASRENPLIVYPKADRTYIAFFVPSQYYVSVKTNNEAYGSVSGGGRYDYNTKHTITATPATGYHFVSWNDGNTDASREITVKGSDTYTATFAINTYTIKTASNDPAKGTVSAGGKATYNSELTLEATAKEGYYFKQWNDGNFDNPRTVKATGDVTYTATFVAPAPFDKTALNNALRGINNKGTAFTLTFDYTTPESYEGTPVSAGDNLRIFYTGTTDGKAHYTVAPSYSGGPIIAPADCSDLFNGLGKMTSIEFRNFNTEKVTNMSYMFFNCETLTTLNLSSFNTEKVTDMHHMFMNCKALTTLNLSSFNTEKVTNMNSMFNCCEALTTLDLSSFNTAKVTNMSDMFHWCDALTTLDLSSFNTEEVTNMNSMFNGCLKLMQLDLSSFNTAKVTNMSDMFFNCEALTTLDLSSFNTAKVTDMSCMFYNCEVLTTLDLSSFNTEEVTDMNHMFYGCNKLKGIKVGYEFTTDAVTNSESMFGECTQLVGPKGTTYNDAFIDKIYAHVDGGKSNPGYFTSSEYTIVDLALLIRAVKQGESVSNLPFADVNGDGELDLNDIEVLRKILLEIIGKTTETLPGDGNEPTPDEDGFINADVKESTLDDDEW